MSTAKEQLLLKISTRMDILEQEMMQNNHLSNPEEVIELMNSISKFWSVMSEEDQDYLSAARYALSERQVWSKDEQ